MEVDVDEMEDQTALKTSKRNSENHRFLKRKNAKCSKHTFETYLYSPGNLSETKHMLFGAFLHIQIFIN